MCLVCVSEKTVCENGCEGELGLDLVHDNLDDLDVPLLNDVDVADEEKERGGIEPLLYVLLVEDVLEDLALQTEGEG